MEMKSTSLSVGSPLIVDCPPPRYRALMCSLPYENAFMVSVEHLAVNERLSHLLAGERKGGIAVAASMRRNSPSLSDTHAVSLATMVTFVPRTEYTCERGTAALIRPTFHNSPHRHTVHQPEKNQCLIDHPKRKGLKRFDGTKFDTLCSSSLRCSQRRPSFYSILPDAVKGGKSKQMTLPQHIRMSRHSHRLKEEVMADSK